MPDWFGEAQGGIQAGIRHTDDHVRLDGALPKPGKRRPLAGFMDAGPLDHRVGPGEVHIFKDADMAFPLAVGADGAHTGLIHHHNLAGVHFPQVFGPQAVQGAGLGGEDDGALLLADAQGPEPFGIRTAISLVALISPWNRRL